MGKNNQTEIDAAYRHCESIARAHYENFPVASLAIPRNIRPLIYSVYAFARTADDFADEGSLGPGERLRKLDEWGARLEECYSGRAEHPIFVALGETIRRTNIPRELFDHLLTAFRMDVTIVRHPTFEKLLEYCSFSANPVGRIILILFGEGNERNFRNSDKICTALQLTNFWQDIGVDMGKGRIYLPLEDMARFGYTETRLLVKECDADFKALLKFQVDRTRGLFEEGKRLASDVRGRLGFELNLTVRGGLAVLRAIEQRRYDVFSARPAISAAGKIAILTAAMMKRQI